MAGRGDPGVRGWGKGQDALSHILEDQSALPRDWTSELEKPSGGILGNSIRQTRVQKPALLRSSWVITDKLLNSPQGSTVCWEELVTVAMLAAVHGQAGQGEESSGAGS